MNGMNNVTRTCSVWLILVAISLCLAVVCDSCSKKPESKVEALAADVKDGRGNPRDVDMVVFWETQQTLETVPDRIWCVQLKGLDGFAIPLKPLDGMAVGGTRGIHMKQNQLVNLLQALAALANEPGYGTLEQEQPKPGIQVLATNLLLSGHSQWGANYAAPLSPNAEKVKKLLEEMIASGKAMDTEQEVQFLSKPMSLWLMDDMPARRMLQIKTESSTAVLRKWATTKPLGRPSGLPGSLADKIVHELAIRENQR